MLGAGSPPAVLRPRCPWARAIPAGSRGPSGRRPHHRPVVAGLPGRPSSVGSRGAEGTRRDAAVLLCWPEPLLRGAFHTRSAGGDERRPQVVATVTPFSLGKSTATSGRCAAFWASGHSRAPGVGWSCAGQRPAAQHGCPLRCHVLLQCVGSRESHSPEPGAGSALSSEAPLTAS